MILGVLTIVPPRAVLSETHPARAAAASMCSDQGLPGPIEYLAGSLDSRDTLADSAFGCGFKIERLVRGGAPFAQVFANIRRASHTLVWWLI
jgi:hypothetical protein